MIAIRSLVFNFLFFAWSVLLMILCLPLLLLPQPFAIWVARLWSSVSLFLLRAVCGLGHEIRGLEHLPPGPCIVASKHQSAWDTLIFATVIEGPVYIFKRELMRIPLFGWYVRGAGCIPIDRRGGAAALRRMIDHARRVVARGRKILIFPEGTRVAPGSRQPYHPGTAALYAQLGVPVVPVAVNSGLYWGRRTFLKRPGRIVLEFLPPIAPGMPRKAFAAELERQIEAATNALISGASPPAVTGPRPSGGNML